VVAIQEVAEGVYSGGSKKPAIGNGTACYSVAKSYSCGKPREEDNDAQTQKYAGGVFELLVQRNAQKRHKRK
jgi:hypothetical protein